MDIPRRLAEHQVSAHLPHVSSRESYEAQLSQVQFATQELLSLLEADNRRKLEQHTAEVASLQELINSLQLSHGILKKEKKHVKAHLQAALAAANALAAKKSKVELSDADQAAEVVDLQTKLIDLNNRLLDINLSLEAAEKELKGCSRADERDLLSVKMVVMQDTKRILSGEIDAIRDHIFRKESATKTEMDKVSAEESGYAELARLEEQLQHITTRIDHAKQAVLFPEAKGYRFAGGSNGVYIGAGDLFLSEISGRVHFTCERVERADGVTAARVCLKVGGVCASRDWTEGRGSGRRAAAGTQPAAAAAPAAGAPASSSTSFTAPPSQQQQQQQLFTSGDSVASTSAATAAVAGSNITGMTSGGGGGGGLTDHITPGYMKHGSGADAAAAAAAGNTARPTALDVQLSGSIPSTNLNNDQPSAAAAQLYSSPSRGGSNGGDGLVQPLSPASFTQIANQPLILIDDEHFSRSTPLSEASPTPSRGGSVSGGGGGGDGSAATAAVPHNVSPTQHRRAEAPGLVMAAGAAHSSTGETGSMASAGGVGAGGTLAGSDVGDEVAGGGAVKKGQMMTGFLKSLSKKKEKLQQIAGVQSSGLTSSGMLDAGSSSGGAPGPGGDGHGKLGDHVSKLREGLTGHMDRMKEGFGGRMDRMKEGLGDRVDRMKEGLAPKMEKVKEGLGDRVDRMKEGLGDKVDKMKEGLAPKMERVKEGLGDRVDKVKGSLRDGLQSKVVDRMKEGLQEGLQDSKASLGRKLASVMSHNNNTTGGSQQGLAAGLHTVPPRAPSSGPAAGTAHSSSSSQDVAANSQSRRSFDNPSSGTDHPLSDMHLTSNPQEPTYNQQLPAHAPRPASTHHAHSHSSGPAPHTTSTPPPVPLHARHQSVTDDATGAAVHRSRSSGDGLRGGGVGVGTSDGGGAGGSGAAAGGPARLSVAFEDFDQTPARNGLYVQLLAERVQLVGERGTKVPDLYVSEIMLEVEVALTASMEWTPLDGWTVAAGSPLDLSILQLDHKMQGNTIPLPRTALKALLNMFLPGVVTRLLLRTLPPELGHYVVESGEQLKVGGEFKVRGPPLSTYMAPLSGPQLALKSTLDAAGRAAYHKQIMAAQRARQLLGLSELQAECLSELFSGPHALVTPPRPVSICELCRLLVAHSSSHLWAPLCKQWNKALKVAFDWYGVPPEDQFNFNTFMECVVSRLVRKPVQVAFMLDTLQVHVDVDALLGTLHNWFTRLVVDLHRRSEQGDDGVAVPAEPLDIELEHLALWHAALSAQVRQFKERFKTAGGTLVASADKQEFQVGAEDVSYDGPLRLKLPLDLLIDNDFSFVVDVKLPERQGGIVASMLQGVMAGLRAVSGGVASGGDNFSQQQPLHVEGGAQHQQQEEAEEGGAARSGRNSLESRRSGPANSSGGGGGRPSEPGWELPVLSNPMLGQLCARKLAVSLKLDEERIITLLSTAQQGGSELVSTLLGCYGDLFTTSLDVGWRTGQPAGPATNTTSSVGGGEGEPVDTPTCLLTIANNEITRVSASIQSLVFNSCVPPHVALSVLYVVVRGVLLRLYSQDSYQVRFWQRLSRHLHEYLSQDSLDAAACLRMKLELQDTGAKPRQQGGTTNSPPDPTTSKLRMMLSGDEPAPVKTTGGGAEATGLYTQGGDDKGGSADSVPPFFLVNEINLLTLFDSIRLFKESQ